MLCACRQTAGKLVRLKRRPEEYHSSLSSIGRRMSKRCLLEEFACVGSLGLGRVIEAQMTAD